MNKRALLFIIAFAGAAAAQEELVVERLDLREARVADVARLLATTSDLNVVVTPEAGERVTNLFLQRVPVRQAIETLCKVSGLWFRDEQGIVRIMTAEQYQADLVVQRDAQVRVFTLLHPNSVAVAGAIRDLFGGRVRLSLGLNDQSLPDPALSSLSGQAVFGSGTQSFSERLNGIQQNAFVGQSGVGTFGGAQQGTTTDDDQEREAERLEERLTAEQLSRLEQQGGVVRDAEGLTEGRPPIAVTVNRRHNLVVVRTSDADAMAEIERLVVDLDRPTPQVLLEMKVLELRLGDGMRTGLDVDLIAGPPRTNFETGEPTNPLARTAATVAEQVVAAGNPPLQGGALVYQFLNEHIRVRLEALGREDRVGVLATPLLLCANNEAARIFIGEERPLVRNFQLQTITTNGVVTNQVVPTVDLRDIGNSLRIVPRINADRTVTLTIIQDVSTVNIGGAQLPVPAGNGVTVVDVDTVDTANLEGTVIAKDGLTLAVGGLIRKELRDRQSGIPYLMDLPLVGWLFGETERVEEQRELLLLITPHVLMTPAEGQARSRERLEQLSLHPYHDIGDAAMQRYDRSDVPGSEGYRLLIEDYLRPAPEPIR
jgi:type II secretory pathway component GspD/PulD (secretin)